MALSDVYGDAVLLRDGVDKRALVRRAAMTLALVAALGAGMAANARARTADVPPISYGVADDTG
ncbi:MAG: hypothetical protein KGI93_10730, partial [Acidobacteriota bacterium]|nr:hypothetical protein [Acidobacteriota bacterium]